MDDTITIKEVRELIAEKQRRGLTFAGAVKATTKALTGRVVLMEDGEEVAAGDIEFVAPEGSEEPQEAPNEPQGESADTAKALADITKRLDAAEAKANRPRIQVSEPEAHKDAKGGFKSAGEFYTALIKAGTPDGGIDARLKAPTTFGNESSGADGGFLVPPEFANEIKQHAFEASLLPLTDNMQLSGNSIAVPADETTAWGTNGLRAYWSAEGAQGTQSKPALKSKTLRLHKLLALAPVTDELLDDTTALETYLSRKIATSINWKVEDSFINGTGAGQPLGIANAGSLVTVAKETSQTADTIVTENVTKMFARLPMGPTASTRWIVNHDAINQLYTLKIGDTPIFIPPGQGNQSPGGTLLGIPVVSHQSAQTLGDLGDIYLSNWAAYLTATKSGGIDFQSSIHLFFDYDQTAFRSTFRVDGQPWYDTALSANNGSNNLSDFVTLAART